MHEQFWIDRLSRSLNLTLDLAQSVDDKTICSRNGTARSNTIGAQFWCIVGARESYARAIPASKWQGFSCSLKSDDTSSPVAIYDALTSSRDLLLTVLRGAADPTWNEAQMALLTDLLEHEAQHHGQLIRFFYANDIPFPHSFASRYALK